MIDMLSGRPWDKPVDLPCDYCGVVHASAVDRCPSCGAPMDEVLKKTIRIVVMGAALMNLSYMRKETEE